MDDDYNETLRKAANASKPKLVSSQELQGYLSIGAWIARPVREPDRLLGDLLTTTTRLFLVGRMGLGKSQLGYAAAVGAASSQGFVHWRCHRPARVLYVDGEMSEDLIKARSQDALRRAGLLANPPPNLAIYSADTAEAVNQLFGLGMMPPLNEEAGHDFIEGLITAIGGVDAVFFDNVMSLVKGDHREETTWSGVLPLVEKLTRKRCGQVWIDHTGHNTDRQYGASTKAWRFDSAGIMTALPEDQREPLGIGFTLSFDFPGKARRRSPENWQDFDTRIIRLKDDQWTSEPIKPAPPADRSDTIRGHDRMAFLVLRNRVAQIGQRGVAGVPLAYLSIAETEWRDAFYANAMPGAENDAKQKAFRRAADRLTSRQMVAVYNHRVWLC